MLSPMRTSVWMRSRRISNDELTWACGLKAPLESPETVLNCVWIRPRTETLGVWAWAVDASSPQPP
jgi:hypothetical protein